MDIKKVLRAVIAVVIALAISVAIIIPLTLLSSAAKDGNVAAEYTIFAILVSCIAWLFFFFYSKL